MITIIYKPLSYVFHLYTNLLELTAVNDHLMRTSSIFSGIKNSIMFGEFFFYIVGIKDG